ncbi:unnamed protein product [Thlaspi arvense]|uniref:ABC transporter domain-containing protein n=1 Tax=Thlaspi arvense TaxID=13288 RepID=A0AAU9SJW4_THLAR|nr:unnamed protein product [Thlaspi arvense]
MPVRFVVGGDGPKHARLEEMREKHSLQDRVEMYYQMTWLYLLNDMVRAIEKAISILPIHAKRGVMSPREDNAFAGSCRKTYKSLDISGEVTYNGYRLNEFVPIKTSAYISQNDFHIDLLNLLARREKDARIFPEADVDLFMKASAAQGVKSSLITDYTLKILGLDICKDTIVGDDMMRGISGGQKKRVTTGEMIVGPTKPLFMDEISTGLDSSTTFQIVKCLQQIVHLTEATVLISLLQPAPETFDLFDDIILLSKGQLVYQGPRGHILEEAEPPTNEEYDSDDWETLSDDFRLYEEEWAKSGGFDVDFSKLRHTFGSGFVDPDDEDGWYGEPGTGRDFLNRLCNMAISFYKEHGKTGLELVRVLRANYHPSFAITLYITFEANDPSHGNQTKENQCMVRYCPRDTEV